MRQPLRCTTPLTLTQAAYFDYPRCPLVSAPEDAVGVDLRLAIVVGYTLGGSDLKVVFE